MAEIYKHDVGKLVVGYSGKKLSIGLLILNPKTEYPKHNRPVLEQLTQVYGNCTMKLFDNGIAKEIILKEEEKLEIPANKFHIHTNPNNELSITMWKFEGNITQVINDIRKSMKRIR